MSKIDMGKVRSCKGKRTCERVENDIFNVYKITNIDRSDDDEYCYYVAEQLANDYNNGRLNYDAYIDTGMNLRVLMELRKSCLIRFENNDAKYWKSFLDGHEGLDTQDKIRRYRVDFMRKYTIKDYFDLDWQFVRLMRFMWGNNMVESLVFDFEDACEDTDGRGISSLDDTTEDFIFAQTQPRDVVIRTQIAGRSYLKGIVLDGIEL